MLQNQFRNVPLLSKSPKTTLQYLQTRTWAPQVHLPSEKVEVSDNTVKAEMPIETIKHLLSFSGNNSNTAQWLDSLTEQTIEFIANQRQHESLKLAEEQAFQKSCEAVIEHFYYVLKVAAHDFNLQLSYAELNVASTAPALVTEHLRYNRMRQPIESVTKFRTRLSTRTTSLVIRGSGNSIQFFLIPVEQVIGLCKIEAVYKPFLELKATRQGNHIVWWHEELVMCAKSQEEMCRQLFTQLIEQTKQEMQEKLK